MTTSSFVFIQLLILLLAVNVESRLTGVMSSLSKQSQSYLVSSFTALNEIPRETFTLKSMGMLKWLLIAQIQRIIGSGQALAQVSTGLVDFASLELSVSPGELDLYNLKMMPFLSTSIAIPYNIPGFKSQLILSRLALVKIFTKQITHWNDPLIQSTNRELLPNETIRVVVRSDISGTTEVITRAFTKFAFPDWTFGINSVWPINNSSMYYYGNGGTGLSQNLILNDYSITYESSAVVLNLDLTIASLLNKAGKVVQPTLSSIQSALGGINSSNGATQDIQDSLMDSSLEGSYPIVALSFIIFHYNNFSNCEDAAILYSYLRWIFTSETANIVISTSDAPVSSSIIPYNVALIDTIYCGGITMRTSFILKWFGIAATIFVSLFVVGALIAFIICVVSFCIHKKHQQLKRIIDFVDEGPENMPLVMMFTDIQNSTRTWEEVPADDMAESIKVHHHMMRTLLKKYGGYEVKTEGDAFMVVFTSAVSAVLCVNSFHLALLRQDWPQSLINFPTNVEIKDNDDNMIFRGFRVRIGLHYMETKDYTTQIDPTTKRTDYFGPGVNYCARIADIANGGSTWISEELHNIILKENHFQLGYPYTRSVGFFHLQGFKEEKELFLLLPYILQKRDGMFIPNAKKDKKAKKAELNEAPTLPYLSSSNFLTMVKTSDKDFGDVRNSFSKSKSHAGNLSFIKTNGNYQKEANDNAAEEKCSTIDLV